MSQLSREHLSRFSSSEASSEFLQVLTPFMGERLDAKTGTIPYLEEELDPNYQLFPIEIEQVGKLLKRCDGYMEDREDRELIRGAAGLSLIAHQAQYRDSTHPYSTHALAVANEMALKYQMDAVSIASALLHDTFEDTHLKPVIQEFMPQEVLETVKTLSKIKGRKQRKEIIDEENRLRILGSLLDNPRVAIIKIFDRLHNIKTLHFIKRRARRLAIIRETEEIYIPLAKRLGLYKEADELDDWCLRQLSPEHSKFVDFVTDKIHNFYTEYILPTSFFEEIPDIKELVEGGILSFHYRLPEAHDIYRRTGGIKETLSNFDYYLNVDVELLDLAHGYSQKDWVEQAFMLVTKLMVSGFEIDKDFNLASFQEELTFGLTDSLSVNFRRRIDGLHVRVNIFPKDIYQQEQINLADLYYRRPPLSFEEEQDLARENDPIALRHLLALQKSEHLKRRYEEVMSQYRPGVSFHFLRLLAPRLPDGYIRIVGVDEEGNKQPWPVPSGSTAMDCAKFIFTQSWPSVSSISVRRNGRFEPVPFDYVLQPGEVIHIRRRTPETHVYDPRWIHSFRTDEDGLETVRRKIKAIIKKEAKEGKSNMRNRVISLGYELIERYLKPEDRPLRVGLAYARHVLEEVYSDINEQEFCLRVGLGEVDEEVIRVVAQALVPANKRVGTFRVNFSRDAAGQTDAVSSIINKEFGISMLRSVSYRITDEGPSCVEFYLAPEDTRRAEDVISSIIESQRCLALGMESVDFQTQNREIHMRVGNKM